MSTLQPIPRSLSAGSSQTAGFSLQVADVCSLEVAKASLREESQQLDAATTLITSQQPVGSMLQQTMPVRGRTMASLAPLLEGPPRQDLYSARARFVWAELCRDLGVNATFEEKWWETLHKSHTEAWRGFHTLQRLCELLDMCERYARFMQDPAAMKLAMFFRDAKLNPALAFWANDRLNAKVVDEFGQEALPPGDPPGLRKGELIKKVGRWITLKSSLHTKLEDEDEDFKLFMDIELSILGASRERYMEYSKQIFFEYSHLPIVVAIRARRSVLNIILAKTPLYTTENFRLSHEKRARENIECEVADLTERFHEFGFFSRLGASLVLTTGVSKRTLFIILLVVILLVLAWRYVLLALGVLLATAFLYGVMKLSCCCIRAPFIAYPYPVQSQRPELVVLAGSYNPPHYGHLEMLRYLSKAHEKVVAVIGVNPNKTYQVTPYQRQELLRAMVEELELPNVEVVVWDGPIFSYAQWRGAGWMFRGIRSWWEDGCAEKTLEFQNMFYPFFFGMWPVPTAYLQAAPHLVHVSSTLLRQRFKDKEKIADLVPPKSADMVKQAYGVEAMMV